MVRFRLAEDPLGGCRAARCPAGWSHKASTRIIAASRVTRLRNRPCLDRPVDLDRGVAAVSIRMSCDAGAAGAAAVANSGCVADINMRRFGASMRSRIHADLIGVNAICHRNAGDGARLATSITACLNSSG
ncbi:MAG: hypothetical protein IPP59_09620 [Betaproteobacteria bacterium]|nr:hypothetical protein [Candidatus Dechloromonas phosphorivorans]